jgi:alpha-tubulin suppressor-like RCC1 family protein
LDSAGCVWAFGSNAHGQLGLEQHKIYETTSFDTNAVKIPGLPEIKKIKAGYNHSLLLDVNGCVWAFGQNSVGQIADGHTNSILVPTQMEALKGIEIVDITAGASTSIAVDKNGVLFLFGFKCLAKPSEPSLPDSSLGKRTEQVPSENVPEPKKSKN